MSPRNGTEKACKRLWCAVLEQAIRDAQGDVSAHRRRVNHIFREDALAWLYSENQTIGSFLWICAILDIEPKFIRKLAAREDNGGARFAEWSEILSALNG